MAAAMITPRIVLQPRRARPFYGRHPWVFAGAIASVEGSPVDGDEVDVHAHGGQFIARGLYNSRSRIRVRLYTWHAEQRLDREFFGMKLDRAIALRRDVLRLVGPGRACRLVFSEGDGLSGMTLDQYDRWLVLQFTGLGLANRRELFADLLTEMFEPAGIYLRTERGVGRLEGLELQDGLLRGSLPTEPILIREPVIVPDALRESDQLAERVDPGGRQWLEFLVDLAEGQKTGFYLDQRENRQLVAGLAAGSRVLDAFCYTGGFGLHAARAGAREVIGVDVSAHGLDLARQNAARNGLANLRFEQADVFEYLEAAVRAGERFGLIVLDPPKFARQQKAVDAALQGYRRLQTLALLLLEPGGVLATCCCSGHITMTMLEELAAQIAADARRSVQILHRRHQPPDHPVSVSCLESSYLKCLITRVE
jgi:23S rRNA (cytosine1962-C5)-methyltransferase